MVFRIGSFLFFALVVLALLDVRAAEARPRSFYFDGINLSLNMGLLAPHSNTYPSPEDASLSLNTQVGLLTSGALGFWFSLPEGFRWRSELEAGYSRFQLSGQRSDSASQAGRGSITNVLVGWNNHIHFTDRFAAHQPYIGAGIGGAQFDIDYYNEGASFDRAPEWYFSASAVVGYQYRLTRQLGVGGFYRYYHLFSAPQDIGQSQVILLFSYGF